MIRIIQELEGKSRIERRNVVRDYLIKNKIKFYEEEYSYLGGNGVNIIFELGKGEKEILLITHYDAFADSPGANDNGSAISVLFEVYKNLIKYNFKNKIKFIIFDQEEPFGVSFGCIGSKDYVKKHSLNNVIAAYDLELCGIGDMIGLWPITKFNKDSYSVENLRKTMRELGIYFEEVGNLPYFYADFLPFHDSGFRHCCCITAVPKEEKDLLRDYVNSNLLTLILKSFFGKLTGKYKIPKLLQHYHCSLDRSEFISEESLRMVAKVLIKSLLRLDGKFQ